MYSMLNMSAGSVGSVGQYFYINSPTAMSYNDVTKGEDLWITDYRQNMFNLFIKDDWKVNDSLTLHLGLRYEWFGVPYLANGMTTSLKGGALSVFGRSGRSFSDWMSVPDFIPGQSINYRGEDAEIAFVGPDSPNPGQQLYNDDWNNFAPSVGFNWQLPWGGKGKTTLHGGYSINYLTAGRANITYPPGVARDYTDTGPSWTSYTDLSNLGNVLPVRVPEHMKTPAADPVIPVNQRQQSITVYDPNLRTPYVQNLTLAITRNIGSSLTVDLRYIGQLTRKQPSTINLNSSNFISNGLKDVFDAARRGENPVELDRMFNGVSLMAGAAPVGTEDDAGVYQTGAMHLRGAFQPSAQQLLANGRYAELATELDPHHANGPSGVEHCRELPLGRERSAGSGR